jgi:transposase InsO family protein
MDHYRKSFPIAAMSRVLGVSRSGYYARARRPRSNRQRRREELITRIRQSHRDSRDTYGSPRVCADLRGRGVKICVNTVARYMREESIHAARPRPFRVMTTDSRHDQPVAANVLNREFQRGEPNTGWVSDITYVPTAEGWLFLAVVIDLCSRRVVGHATGERLKSSLALEALEMALRRRSPCGASGGAWQDQGLLHHSDRGVQYACVSYRATLEAHGITPSMSRPGNCYDNAVAESFFATLKRELVHRRSYATRAAARQSLFEYIEVFYNRQRKHSALGYQSPAQFEQHRAVA